MNNRTTHRVSGRQSGDATIGEFNYRGSTALVTGASSGIGEAIARALAARSVAGLVLVARSADRLAALGNELRSRHGLRVDVIAADLREADAAIRVNRETDRLGLAVDLLVNDAGVGISGPFEAANQRPPEELVAVNVTAVVALTRLYLPGMLTRGRGGVLNVASNAAYHPIPFSAAYGASKAFVLSLSEALWAETRGRGVRVVCVVPGVTATNLAGPGRGEPRPVLDLAGVGRPEGVAAAALAALDRNDPSAVVGAGNAALTVALDQMPRALAARVIASLKRPDELRYLHPFPAGPVALALSIRVLAIFGAVALVLSFVRPRGPLRRRGPVGVHS